MTQLLGSSNEEKKGDLKHFNTGQNSLLQLNLKQVIFTSKVTFKKWSLKI